jgi:hypothetical protein
MSKTLCDWLFLLRLETSGGMFVLFSSEDSITETLYHLRKRNPTADGALTGRRQDLFRASLDDILDDFPGDVGFPGEDEHDQHVHAAAISCQARYLITDDKGFKAIDSDALPYEVHSTDSFLMLVAANAPQAIDSVIIKQLTHYSVKPGAKKLDAALDEAGCIQFAECVRTHIKQMAEGESTQATARKLLAAQFS